MSRLELHMKKMHPDTVKPMDKQATTDCSFSSDEDVEDVAVKAKIEEIQDRRELDYCESSAIVTTTTKQRLFKKPTNLKRVNDQVIKKVLFLL